MNAATLLGIGDSVDEIGKVQGALKAPRAAPDGVVQETIVAEHGGAYKLDFPWRLSLDALTPIS